MPTATIATQTFRALGTSATLLVTDPDALAPACSLLAAELAAIDAACSRFRSDSELWRVNHARGHPVPVSELFADALSVALAAAALTDGDVDPTCGLSLVRLGYDQDFARARRRTRPLRRPLAPAGGWRRVRFEPGLREVTVPAGVMLDLGATAKALAADRAATSIAVRSACGVLVNLGGDISVAGQPPADGWRVGIADDVAFETVIADVEPSQVVVIRDGGLATSSTASRAWRRGGAGLHHIVVPATGRPAESCWRTVSVAAASCVDANIASTAAILRGGRAPGWLDGLGLPARLVRHDGSAVTVGGWPS
jgi:FAD:protein FMN transferase